MKAHRASDLTTNAEIAALVETIQDAEHRLGELTQGEVDSVSDRLGRTFMLRGAQEQLRDREARRQAAILNALPGPIALIDPAGVIVSVNAAWRAFGKANGLLHPDACLGANYLEICDRATGRHSTEAPEVAAGIRSVLSGQDTAYCCLEYPCDSPDERRWFAIAVHPLSEDLRDGAVVMHSNISAQREAQRAFSKLAHDTEQREKMLNTLLSNISDFAYIFDVKGRVLFANQPLLNRLQVSLESAIGKTVVELMYPQGDLANLSHAIQDVVNTQSPAKGEIPFISESGVYGSYEYILTPVMGADGSVQFVAGSTRDVSDRVRSANALQQSQKRLREIIDGLGPSMFVALLTPEGILVEINRPPLEAAGLQPEDVLGKPFDETPWWTHSPAAQKQLREAIQRAALGEPSRYDVRAHGANGGVMDLDFSIQPLRDESGQVVFLIPSASVITDRKQTEAALRQAQKMEAVGELAAGVAHEFNNILQTLMSMATLVRLRSLSPEIATTAGEMEMQIRRGASVTQQLLLTSRHHQLSTAIFDLAEELRTAGTLLRRLLPENIALVIPPAAPAWVEGDAGQIQQVLLNLAINARDAMPGGGTLTMGLTTTADLVTLTVQDNGEGFDDAIRERLFEPFFTTKGVGSGTGLGLAVVYGIVQQHGGRIEVNSTPGQGSSFHLILPAAEAGPAGATAAAPDVKTVAATARVLLVEDEEGVRQGITMLLEMIGYEVIAVGRGEDALQLPLEPVPDLLLCDVSLPGIGGPALAERLCDRWPFLKVTLMTGYADAATRELASAQTWTILQKPFDLTHLSAHLEREMERQADCFVRSAQ